MQLALILLLWTVAAALVVGLGYIHIVLGFLAMFPVYKLASVIGDRITGVTRKRRRLPPESPDPP